MAEMDLQSMEAKAYTESFGDGVVDLFIGLSILWIGIAWQWIEPLAGLAGVFPAVLVPALVPLRRAIVEPRAGFVSWSMTRRKWERRQMLRLLGLSVFGFVAGIGAFVATSENVDLGSLVAGFPAILLAIPAFILGIASGIGRLLGYGAVLTAAGIATILLEADPGIPLVVAGAVVSAVGLVLFIRFLEANPRRNG